MNKFSVVLAVALSGSTLASAKDYVLSSFKKIQLSDKFWCEGASFGDFNHDGKPDIVSGPYWWEGPDYQKRHEYYPATKTFKLKKADGAEETIEGFEGALGANNAYSDNFFAFTYDFNKDGWDDILILGFPGEISAWYENPKGREGHWQKHIVLDVTDNESPTFTDITGDGKPEIVCSSKGSYGYAEPDWSDPGRPWKFHAISPNNNYHKFTHGLGVGDVNGDGLNDVITSFAAHGYGLVWYEQLKQEGEITFKQHVILKTEQKPSPNDYGVTFSQLHAVDLVDVDGDGLKDIVTGKRFWAHGAHGDPDPNAPAVLYWFRLVRNKDKTVDFVPHLIDSDSGVGTQVVARDFTGDKKPDIVVGNKKGTFVFIQETRKVTKAEWEKAQPKPATPATSGPATQ